jgi:GNAT superfamily N-acetyltransferase
MEEFEDFMEEEEEEEGEDEIHERVRLGCDFVERFGRFIKTREETKFFNICYEASERRTSIVAQIYVRFIQDRFTIAKITTFEEFQRRGIARRIVRLTKELCALHGCTARFECVNSDIMASLLRSESFKAVPETHDYDWQASSIWSI